MNITAEVAEEIGGEVERVILNNKSIQIYFNSSIESYVWVDVNFRDAADSFRPQSDSKTECRDSLKQYITDHVTKNYIDKKLVETVDKSKYLITTLLPLYNCSNCEHFIADKHEVIVSKEVGCYAIECKNLVHPLQGCILRGFEGHSLQPGSSQTLSK